MDHKPFLSALQAMVSSAELLDQASSSRHDTEDDTDPSNDTDRLTATLSQIIAAMVASALKTAKWTDSSPPHFDEATTQLANMNIRLSPGTLMEMDLGRIQVTRTARGTTVEAHRKI
jgi:hypothetical protein